jgi:speckle-type POZ protein
MSAPSVSSHTHSGTAPPGYHQEWVTHTVHWHGFPSLSSEQEESFDSPEFMLLGNEWLLVIFPGGDFIADEGKVSLYLYNMSDKAIEIDFAFSVNDGNGKQVAYERSNGPEYFGTDTIVRGFTNFASRSDLMSSLVNGALVVEVRMKLDTPTKSVPTPFIPENPVAKMIHGLFLDKKSADIIFEVVSEVGGDKGKDNNASPAHRLIIENCSSVFADLCESHDDSTSPIQINDVTPDIFHLLLSYIYGGKVSDDDMKSHAKEVIDAADKYGVVNLKLEAEASLVEDVTFTIENVKEHILYADSKNLVLLKEAAMDFIVENKSEVIKKMSFVDLVPGTFVRDVLVAMARGERNVGGADVNVDDQYDSLRISELRKRAHEKGLNVDGSREMLIAALKTVHNLESEVGIEDGSSSDKEPEED